METLPVEMLEMIVQQLTPQDLARCSAVCRKWHDVFNLDWMWKPHCDLELEEPLRTIPCVVTPAFLAPEAETSTLSPISLWKLAFMRENHLWKNWRRKDYINRKESIIKSENQDPIKVEFLTDTLVVAQYSNHIEILDASAMPVALVAKSDISVESFSVIEPNMFIAKKISSVEVFNVDISNKTITLMHTISLNSPRQPRALKEHFYICVNSERTKLIVFDLNTGKLLNDEPFPVILNQNENVEVLKIVTSPTSEFLAVFFEVVSDDSVTYKYFIYSLEQRAFLPVTLTTRLCPAFCRLTPSALHSHWVAVIDLGTFKVCNLLTQEVSNLDLNCKSISECNNGFVLCGHEDEEWSIWLKIYSPLHRTLTTIICELPEFTVCEVMNNKIIATFDSLCPSEVSKSVWKTSGRMLECGSVCPGSKFNRSFTKVLNTGYLEHSGKAPWYITYLW